MASGLQQAWKHAERRAVSDTWAQTLLLSEDQQQWRADALSVLQIELVSLFKNFLVKWQFYMIYMIYMLIMSEKKKYILYIYTPKMAETILDNYKYIIYTRMEDPVLLNFFVKIQMVSKQCPC